MDIASQLAGGKVGVGINIASAGISSRHPNLLKELLTEQRIT